MQSIKLSEATANYRWVPFRCLDDDSADAYAPKTGLTFSSGEIKVAKRGTASASGANYATVVEAGNGWYWYQLSQAECDTLGPVMVIVVKTDVFADAALVQIVSYDPQDANALGLARIDAAITSCSPANNAAALLDLADGIETDLTPREALRLMAAVLVGKSSGAGTSTEYFRAAVSDSKVRVTTTISANNRTAVTVDSDT